MNVSMGRSRLLMSRDDTALLIVDVQEKLLNVIPDTDRLVWNLKRLLDGARILGMPCLATEQYPQKLGGTSTALAEGFESIPDKLSFSCAGCEEFVAQLSGLAVSKVLVTGIETHVCVTQTVMDLVAAGYDVYVPVDGVASRRQIDHATALRRMDSAGVTLTTTEAALFEWCEIAGSPEFKKISQLVQQPEPGQAD